MKAGGGCVMTIGEMLWIFSHKTGGFLLCFRGIPVPVQKILINRLKPGQGKIKKDGKEGAEEIGQTCQQSQGNKLFELLQL